MISWRRGRRRRLVWGRIRGRGRLRWGLVMGELGLLGVICEVLGMGLVFLWRWLRRECAWVFGCCFWTWVVIIGVSNGMTRDGIYVSLTMNVRWVSPITSFLNTLRAGQSLFPNILSQHLNHQTASSKSNDASLGLHLRHSRNEEEKLQTDQLEVFQLHFTNKAKSQKSGSKTWSNDDDSTKSYATLLQVEKLNATDLDQIDVTQSQTSTSAAWWSTKPKAPTAPWLHDPY